MVNRLLFESDRLTNTGLDIMLRVVQRAQKIGKLKANMDFELLVE